MSSEQKRLQNQIMDQNATICGFVGLGISIFGALLVIYFAPDRRNVGHRGRAAVVGYPLGLVLVLVGLFIIGTRNEIFAHFLK